MEGFQFLIGRLAVGPGAAQGALTRLFQFLIGRLAVSPRATFTWG